MFALTPNSAACERVFSLMKSMFADEQLSCLGDMLQGSLMLRYNKRPADEPLPRMNELQLKGAMQ